MSRFSFLVLFSVAAAACKGVTPPSSPPPPTNQPPIAVVGGPYNSTSGVINVDGSQSSDPDGNPITFRWNFGDGASGDSVRMSHTYATSGTFTVSLIVSDSKGAKDTASTSAGIVVEQTFVLAGAGNIASGTHIAEQTADLLDQIHADAVFTTGDNAFPDGSDSAYAHYYVNSWGRHLDKTHPVLGNHDYEDPNAKGSFDYFGTRLGATPGLGYYSYDAGTWHVIVLNDHGSDASFLDPSSAQGQWLANDLATHTNKCVLAMWHVPLFHSSNTPGWTSNPQHLPVYQTLYAAGVDVVLNGQQHNYERFAPMNPSGDLDPNGIREFNVGTGGESVDDFTVAIHPNSEARAAVFGVLKLTLGTNRYTWEFVPVPGSTFSDAGSGSCH
jgi:acid phosphatase type 7